MKPDLFDEEHELPSQTAQRRLNELVGIDSFKEEIYRNAAVLLNPESLLDWSKSKYSSVIPAVNQLLHRIPLFIFAGDVGTGKSTLAETFAQEIAVKNKIEITVLRLSLKSRGSGMVGEMTRLLSDAFAEVIARCRNLRKGRALVLVIDEADAIGQSREFSQMHHEDRAGVNALIRGIDSLASERTPALLVMCTNRLSALDPAVRRRSAKEFKFTRPDTELRLKLFCTALEGCRFTADELQRFADLTGSGAESYGHTHSDITNRVLPAALLDAYPTRPLTVDIVANAIMANPPTPPFKSE